MGPRKGSEEQLSPHVLPALSNIKDKVILIQNQAYNNVLGQHRKHEQ